MPCFRLKVDKQLTSFLASFAVRVCPNPNNNSIYADENGEKASQDGLRDNQDNTDNGLWRLSNTELVDEDQDADNRQQPDSLDDNVDPISGLETVWPRP